MNYFIKWLNDNRTKKGPARLIAEHGFEYYGIYAAAREIISQFEGAAPIQVVTSQLGITAEKLEPLFVTGCYRLLNGLLSETELKKAAKRSAEISEKRSAAGKASAAKRWGTPAPEADSSRKPRSKKRGQPELGLPDESDENSEVTNVTHIRSIEDRSNSGTNVPGGNSGKSNKKDLVTIVSKSARKLYNEFHQQQTGTDAPPSAAANVAMRNIIGFLLQQVQKTAAAPEDHEAKTLESFRVILANVRFWGKYESGKIRLVDIDSNLSNIIKNIKSSNGHGNGNHQNGSNGTSDSSRGSRIAANLSNIDNA